MRWFGLFLMVAALFMGVFGGDVQTCRLGFLFGVVLWLIGWIEEKSRYD